MEDFHWETSTEGGATTILCPRCLQKSASVSYSPCRWCGAPMVACGAYGHSVMRFPSSKVGWCKRCGKVVVKVGPSDLNMYYPIRERSSWHHY